MTCLFKPYVLAGRELVGVSKCSACGALTNDPPEMGNYVCRHETADCIKKLTDGIKTKLVSARPRTEPCQHLGIQLRLIECPTCQGSVKVKVHACGLHDECTLGKKLDDVACCGTCKNYEPINKTPIITGT